MNAEQLNKTIGSQWPNEPEPIILQIIDDVNQNVGPEQNIQDFYDVVFNLETAVGFGLDIWGRIVNISREIGNVAPGEYFGFYNPAFTIPDQVYTPWNNAPFYNANDILDTITVNDEIFRKMILGKAYANIMPAVAPTFNRIFDILLGPGNGVVIDNLDMTIQYNFFVPIDLVLGTIIYDTNLLPVPAAVKVIQT